MDMDRLAQAEKILAQLNAQNGVKKIKGQNDGLFERVESQKVVLTEDNKMLLKD